MFKTFAINIAQSKNKLHLGRWKPSPNNFTRKVDLANIDNCGDRVCGNLYSDMKPLIELFDKRWSGEITKDEFSKKIKVHQKKENNLNDYNTSTKKIIANYDNYINDHNYSIKSIVDNYNERWNKNVTVEEYLLNFTNKHRGAC